MATFTERLALIIDAKTGGAVRDIQAVANVTDRIDAPVTRADKAVQSLGLSGVLTGAQLKTGLAAGATVAGFAFAAFAKESIGAASALEEQTNRVGVVFGDAAEQVTDFGDNAARSIGLSERAALQAAGAFGTIFTQIGVGPDQAAELSTAFVRLASDMASFNDIGTDEALQKLQSGLAGETEPLRQVGVFLNEAAVKAKAAELGFGGANRELTEGEKVLARYALIVEQTGQQQGDFSRTSDSLANQQRALQGQVEDLSASIGQILIPIVTDLAGTFNSVLGPITAVTDALGSIEVGGVNLIDAWQRMNIVTGGITLAGDAIDLLTGSEEDAGDAADESADAFQGLGNILSNYRAKSDEAADAAKRRAAAEREAADAVQSSFFAARDAQKNYRDSLESVSDAERGVEDARRDLADANREAAEEQVRLAEEVADAQQAVVDANERVADSYDAIRNAEERLRRATFDLHEQEEETAEARRRHEQNLHDFGEGHHLTVESAEELSDAEEELRRQQYDAEEAARNVTEATEDLADANRDLTDAQDELTDAQHRGAESSNRVRDAAENLSDAEETLRDAQEQAARAAFDLNEKQEKLEESLRASGDAGGFLGDKIRALIELFPDAAPWLLTLAGGADAMTWNFAAANAEIQRTLDLIAKLPGLGWVTGADGTSKLVLSQGGIFQSGDAAASASRTPQPTTLPDATNRLIGVDEEGNVTKSKSTVIHVHPSPGMNEQELARKIAWEQD